MRVRLASRKPGSDAPGSRPRVPTRSCSASRASTRTRSTTRLRRLEVDSTSVPVAEINSAGVIIAASTSPAEMMSPTAALLSLPILRERQPLLDRRALPDAVGVVGEVSWQRIAVVDQPLQQGREIDIGDAE